MRGFLTQPISWESENVRQTVAVGLVIGAVFLIVWTSYMMFSDRRQQALHAEKILAGHERSIDLEPVIRQRLAQLKATTLGNDTLLNCANDALAGAELQENFKAMVQNASGSVERSQSLGSEREGQFQKISVRAQVILSTPSLQRVLYVLETGRPYMFIDNLDVKDAPSQKGAKADLLKVTIDFYGYCRGRNKS